MAPKSSLETVLLFLLTILSILHLFIVVSNGLSIKMIPRFSIGSPENLLNLTQQERHRRIVDLADARILRLAGTTNSTNLDPSMIRPSVAAAMDSYYMVQLSIGTQPFPVYLLLDSGSDIIWVQADGCLHCIPLKGGSFKYFESTTYYPIDCDHSLCNPRICPTGVCQYMVNYIGGPKSTGIVSVDTFTFISDNGALEPVGNVVFGLGLDNERMPFGQKEGTENMIAGVFGLSDQPRSFVTQFGARGRGRFSYCLQSWNSLTGTHSFLRFGDDAGIVGPGREIRTTPFVRESKTYYLNLLDISVGDRLLHLDSNFFKLKPDGSGGFLMDSGFGLTYLVRPAFNVVKTAVVQYFSRYKLRFVLKVRQTGFEICYAYPPGFNNFPSITFHFAGADLVLERDSVFELLENGSYFCMAIRSNDENDFNVLGAFQQTNHRFLYDVGARTLSFSPENCNGV